MEPLEEALSSPGRLFLDREVSNHIAVCGLFNADNSNEKKTLKSSLRDFGNKLCCHFPHFKISFPPAPQFTNLKKGRPRTFICDTRSRKTAVFSRFMTLRSSTNLPRKIHHVQNRECTQKGVTQRYTQMFFWGDVIEKNWNGRSVAWKDRPSRRSHDSLIGTIYALFVDV